MKKNKILEEIKSLDLAGLYKKATELREEQLKLRVRAAGGQLEKPHLLSQLKRDSARVMTLITEKKKTS